MANISQIELPSGDTFDIVDQKSGYITGMTILSYGSSTWSDFIEAYSAKKVVYCRASSNANPASGSQTRLAFMAYVSNADNPTNVEFQYYRSVSSHTASQQGDQIYVYKLDKTAGWTVTTREASVKIKIDTNNEGIKTTYSSGTVSIGHANSVTAQTTQAVYPIAYDAQGHITSSGTAVTIPTQASDIGAQPTLVSGTNIKTINNNSLLGSGNISVQDTLVSGTNIKTINNESLLGLGNITISSGSNYTAGDGIDITSDVISVDSNLTVSGDTAYLDYTTPTEDLTKQDLLVSGTNIKTINNSSILGAGNLDVGTVKGVTLDGTSIVNSNNIAVLTSGTNVKTINNQSIFGSGNINTNSLIYQKHESSYTTVSANTSSIPIGITGYQATDILFVDADGLTLTEGIDYTINNSTNYITLTNPIESIGVVVHFTALRSGLISGAISLDSLKGDATDIGTRDNEAGLDDEALLSTETINKWLAILDD